MDELKPGEKFSEYLNRITPDRPEGVSDQNHAWCMLRGELESEKWTTGEAANYHGFFDHGWDAATRASGEVIRGLVESMSQLMDILADFDGNNEDTMNILIAEKALAQAREYLGE